MEYSKNQWDETERRDGYCPVHHIKCQEIDKIKTGLDSRVPIWVFKLCVTILILALGGMNAYFYRLSTQTLGAIQAHVDVSNTILKRMSLQSRETLLNQKIVMEKLGMPYRKIPSYYGNGKDKRK